MSDAGKTNLLYVFADQWRAQAVGYRGEDQVITPNMDAFAAESMRFTNAFSTFPLCSPHRACLMTGKYPFSTGIWTNCKVGLEEKIMLKPQEVCIGNVLKAGGYETGYIGKWHLDSPEQNFTSCPESGAREWDAYTPPGERRQGFDYWLSYGACDDHLHPHYWQDDETQIRPEKWSAEYETDQALKYMERQTVQARPFALFLSYNPPHLPYELVPDRYYDRFRDREVSYRENVPAGFREKGGKLETITRQYFAAVNGIDEQFGRILAFLKDNGMEENTLVVLSADHGEMLGSHGLMSKNVWYEESIHIPLMMRQKGRIKPGDNETLFASPDHMPTLLELLELPVPETCQGWSHANGMLQGADAEKAADRSDASEIPSPDSVFLCSYPGSSESVHAFERRGLAHKAYGWRGIRDKQYTYVVNRGHQPGEKRQELLYNHESDPFEMNPAEIEEQCDDPVIMKFRRQLREYLDILGDPFQIV